MLHDVSPDELSHKLDWTDATLLNSFTHYGAPYGNVGYAKAFGLVFFRGLANNASAAVGFTLPVGYRPSVQRIFYGIQGSGNNSPFEVLTNGDVSFFSSVAAVTSFDGLFFSL